MIPNTGVVTADQINTEIGRPGGSLVSLNDSAVRALTRNTLMLAAGSAIDMNALRGGTGYPIRANMVDSYGDGSYVGAAGFGGSLSDGVNANPLGTVGGGTTLRQIYTGDPDGGGVRTFIQVDAASPPYNVFFWGIAVYTDAWSPIGILRFDQAGWQTSAFSALRHVNETYIGWYSGATGFLDLRPYKGQWLRFVFTK
jgi:hypothetical protein